METLVVLLQIALSAVLIVASIGKFRDLPGSRQAVQDFGVPEQWAKPAGTALPAAELVLGLGLLIGVTARWAALLAALLFIAFIVAIGYNLSKGRQPDCHCFGQIHSEPAGWPTLIRNLVLTLAALTVVWQGATGPVDWFDSLSRDGEAQVLIGLGILGGIAALWLMLRKLVDQNEALIKHNTALASSIEVLASLASEPVDGTEAPAAAPAQPATRVAPDFDLPTIEGNRISRQSLQEGGTRALLVFADPGCGPCNALTPDIVEWQQRFGAELPIAIISRGTPDENRAKFADKGVTTIALQEEHEIYNAYEVRGTPSAVLIEADGTIKQPYGAGRNQIRDLVSRTMAGQDAVETGDSLNPGANDPSDIANIMRKAEGPAVGSAASRLPLPAIDGSYIGLDDYLGESAVVVFWNVGCGFCTRMLPDLKEIEGEAGDKLSRVLIVSQGGVDENLAQELRSRVVIDDGFNLGKAFGATGTPSAIRLDAEGKVSSNLAIGADAVLDMLDEALELSDVPA